MKHPTKKESKRVQDFLESIDWFFALNNFDREIVIKEQDTDNIAAEFSFREEYQSVTVKIYPCFWTHSLADQRKMLLHELCHSITLPSKAVAYGLLDGKLTTFDRIKDINEEATSKIENMLDSLLRGRKTYAKKAYKDYLKK